MELGVTRVALGMQFSPGNVVEIAHRTYRQIS